MLMEISHLTMAERLKLWKQRKNNGGASETGTVDEEGTITSKRLSTSVEGPNGKVIRKRTRKYINSALSTPQAVTPHPQSNPNPNQSFEKRTKKENDDPNLVAAEGKKSTLMKKSDTSDVDGITDIDGGMQALCLDHHQECNKNTKLEHQPEQHSSPSQVISTPPSTRHSTTMAATQDELDRLRVSNEELSKQILFANHERKEAFKIAQMSIAENKALKFDNEVMNQTIEELETQLTQCRMAAFEVDEDTEKIKQQNTIIRQLRHKNEAYEARANTIVTDMSQQMTMLQDMAMQRIQQLENDLMLEQHKTQTQEALILKLQQNANSQEQEVRRSKTRPRPSHRQDRRRRRQSCVLMIGGRECLDSDNSPDEDSDNSDATQEAVDENDGDQDDDEEEEEEEDRQYDLDLGGDDDEQEEDKEEEEEENDNEEPTI